MHCVDGAYRTLTGGDLLNQELDDPDFDQEDVAAISALTSADIDAIDRAILSQCDSYWRKVAYVVSVAMDAYPDRYVDIPDIYYGARIRELVATGRLDAEGNVARMRFSEVRLRSTDDLCL
ncbi:DUF3658 domain-containing protein [Luteibacter sp.]|uniref:DUF3658 domain-containing protein n=1 Tax=Luteibacter sp. TaxID=1886636 RepID=UPI002808C680|nr:DUF3658 domain-containing protein [Luteibacter sp.]MDQ8051197.1 DUF3658 domain-containing protein [Luteibacter sp.]